MTDQIADMDAAQIPAPTQNQVPPHNQASSHIADMDAAQIPVPPHKQAPTNNQVPRRYQHLVKSLKRVQVRPDRAQFDSKTLDVDTLVASLVATVTFGAMFQVPGGIDDDKNSIHYGVARLAFQLRFKLFLFCDTVAFFTSVILVVTWVFKERFRNKNMFMFLPALPLVLSIIFAAVAFISAASLVIIPANLQALQTSNKEAYDEYRNLSKLLFFGSVTPMLFALIAHMYFMMKGFFELHELGWRWLPVKYAPGLLLCITSFCFVIFQKYYMF